jgi:pimeloyl-ACP methyl ester carboxylesterase
MTQTDSIMTLANGRQLGYAEYGDPNGFPIFFFHGFPGSAHVSVLYNQIERIIDESSAHRKISQSQ